MSTTRTCKTPNCERTFEVGGKTGRPPLHCEEHRNASRRPKARLTVVDVVDVDRADQPA
jgi:hypothetical protein